MKRNLKELEEDFDIHMDLTRFSSKKFIITPIIGNVTKTLNGSQC